MFVTSGGNENYDACQIQLPTDSLFKLNFESRCGTTSSTSTQDLPQFSLSLLVF